MYSLFHIFLSFSYRYFENQNIVLGVLEYGATIGIDWN